MTRNKLILAVAAGLLAITTCVLAVWHLTSGHGDGHEHGAAHDHGEGAGLAALELDHGKKWATNDDLRAGMSRIHDAVKPAWAAHQAGTLPNDDARALANTLRTEVHHLIETCRLDPRADAMLHIVIAELLAGASAMETDPNDANGVPKVVEALHAYARHFDHPGF